MQDHPDIQKLYRARWIVPVCSPIVHNGVVRIADTRVISIEPFVGQSGVIDLGDVAILPALVNAHTHLEFSDLEQPIGHRGISIAAWLPEVLRQRRQLNSSQTDRLAAIERGIVESRNCGVQLLGEIATKPWSADAVSAIVRTHQMSDSVASEPLKSIDLSIVAFCEVLGLAPQRQSELLDWTDQQLQHRKLSNVQWGISPHSPYTVPAALLSACLDRAAKQRLPVAMHIAESLEEREFVEQGTGPLRDAFESLGLPGLDQFPSETSIRQIIERLTKASRGLVIHGNYLTDEEIEAVAEHRERLSVVYCPRTHAHFDHRPHPVRKLLDVGIRVALGTDSRASNPDLNVWNEVRHLLRHRSDLHPEEVVSMVTMQGADALGHPQAGRLQTGSSSGLFLLRTDASSESQFWERLGDAATVHTND
ncbi:MAG: amidohydrolase family protein [Pirellulaceae bacterium]